MDRREFARLSGRWVSAAFVAPLRWPAPERPAEVRWLASDPEYLYSRPCFSPGGDQVLYMRAPATAGPGVGLHSDANSWSLWTVPASGGRETPLFSDASLAATRPDWCPSTGRIAFTGIRGGEAGLWLVDSDGGRLTQVPVGSPPLTRLYYPSWYPDGARLAVTDYVARRVLRVDPGRGTAAPLTRPELVWAGMAAVSPDTAAGNPVAFAGQPPRAPYDVARNRIWLAVPGAEPRPLDRAGGRMPAWAPGGRRLAFTSSRRRPAPTFLLHRRTLPSAQGAVFVQRLTADLRADGPPRAVSPFDHGALHPKWSPDGTRIVCMLDGLATGRHGIAILELPD